MKHNKNVKKKETMIWGWHGVQAALRNPHRKFIRGLITRAEYQERLSVPCDVVPESMLQSWVGSDVCHQGVMMWFSPLQSLSVHDVDPEKGTVVVLDEITDPHNVGAIWRTCAALHVQALFITKHNAPPIEGTVTKAASGATEQLPYGEMTNVAQTLRDLKKKGFFVAGLTEKADYTLDDMDCTVPYALVIGAEGKGLRRLTMETCDMLVSIPGINPAFSTLNASVACAIALYHCTLS